MRAAPVPYIETTLKTGGARTIEGLGLDIAFDLQSPQAQQWLNGKGAEYWASNSAPNATTIDKIHKRIAAGMAEGIGPSEMVKSVQEVFGEAKLSRAEYRANRNRGRVQRRRRGRARGAEGQGQQDDQALVHDAR